MSVPGKSFCEHVSLEPPGCMTETQALIFTFSDVPSPIFSYSQSALNCHSELDKNRADPAFGPYFLTPPLRGHTPGKGRSLHYFCLHFMRSGIPTKREIW